VAELLNLAAIVLGNLVIDQQVSQSILEEFDMVLMMRKLMEKYLLSDYFGVAASVGQTRAEEVSMVVKLAVEFLWLTNNFISHMKFERLPNNEQQLVQMSNVALQHGLDNTYLRMV